tara:strand:+ start:5966 stop:6574 length:609 start_codon:yes stop_codon:yes gene_type:complete
MKNKLIQRFFSTVAILALLVLSVGNSAALTNNSSVVSPYWQTDSDAYSFIAVSHPSLQGTNSEIGVVLNVMTDDGTTVFGTTAFTVANSETTRVFIVATNHGTINSTNITASSVVFITGTTNASSGSLSFTPRSSNPLLQRESTTQNGLQTTDITSLSYWGAVVVSSTNSGFAMEFIGDTHDSAFTTLTQTTAFTQSPVGLN